MIPMNEFSLNKVADSYYVLARKYRPVDFSDMMVGQEPMIRTLTNAFETGRIAHAYMLSGVRGVGKTTTARIIARALNYKNAEIDFPTITFKSFGQHCHDIMRGQHVDVVEIDAASHTGIDDIREIVEQVRYRPVLARYKVYIIDEVHMLSTAAFNGLLKTLEEPPPYVKFIFATTEIRKVPITVLSRCQRFDLRRIPVGSLIELFTKILVKESIEAEAEAIAIIARMSEGSARDGLSLLDQAIAQGEGRIEAQKVRYMLALADRKRIIDLFGYLVKGDVASALREFSEQYEAGVNPVTLLTDLADFTHVVTRLKYVPETVKDDSLSEIESLCAIEYAREVPVTLLSHIWQMLVKGISEVENCMRPVGATEMVLIRLAYAAAYLPSPEEVVRLILKDKEGKKPEKDIIFASSDSSDVNHHQVSVKIEEKNNIDSYKDNKVLNLHDTLKNDVKTKVSSVEEILDLCEKNNDFKIKTLIQEFLRVVRLKPGQLEVYLAEGAPSAFLHQLAIKLKDWTGMQWTINLASKEENSVKKVTETSKDIIFKNMQKDPDVLAAVECFPGAKVSDIYMDDDP
ncbi:DNA polymerase III subunits gamma and tau [Liberibacter crescens BT-1]|uniref:DNA polymerase III subunit gamma/tau n=2 Tax=Liberibacter crescens TaxID=1273132 RepID=L0ETA8_LIBCB|nr:DNA polymerase III subunits gamma and tau [Liberibacter crescens BT-1]